MDDVTDENLKGLLKCLYEVIEHFDISSARSQLRSCSELLNQTNILDVVVLGRFKAGKSSFLNNVVQKEVFPVGVTPLTAVITRILFGEVEKAEIHFLDGSVKLIAFPEIAQFVTEKLNPNNQKQVALVEMTLPTLRFYQGLRFVDTPGLGSIFKHNTQTAEEWLPKAGIAIVAISSDSVISEQDISLIKELRRFTPKIILLLTKVDLFAEKDLKEIEKFVTAQLKEFGLEIPIFKYSVHPSHISLRQDFDNSDQPHLFESLRMLV